MIRTFAPRFLLREQRRDSFASADGCPLSYGSTCRTPLRDSLTGTSNQARRTRTWLAWTRPALRKASRDVACRGLFTPGWTDLSETWACRKCVRHFWIGSWTGRCLRESEPEWTIEKVRRYVLLPKEFLHARFATVVHIRKDGWCARDSKSATFIPAVREQCYFLRGGHGFPMAFPSPPLCGFLFFFAMTKCDR